MVHSITHKREKKQIKSETAFSPKTGLRYYGIQTYKYNKNSKMFVRIFGLTLKIYLID